MQRPDNDTPSLGGFPSSTYRRVLSILRDRSEAMTVEELAERVATTHSDSSPETEPGRADSYQVRLHHRYLPKLEDVGLVDWDKETQTVAPTDRAIADVQRPDEPLSAENQGATDSVLADDRRREIIAILKSTDAPITRQHLALELAATGAVGEAPSENIEVQLHHCHLPKLADAGFLQYNRSEGTIAYQGPADQVPATSHPASDA